MSLAELAVRKVRNLQAVRIAPGAGLNIIFGANASGKTSLLEAIHLLGLARSFRTTQIRHVITRGEASLQVFGRIQQEEGRLVPAGVERSPQATILRLGGASVSVAELAVQLPLQLITPESHALLEQGPRLRRQFVDWGVFHVERRFLGWWRDYHRALRQRNVALRRSLADAQVTAWDAALAESGSPITQARVEYLAALRPVVTEFTERLFDTPVSLEYQAGWPHHEELTTALQAGLAHDRRVGHTRLGPHRAEVVLKAGSVPAQQSLSRGQQKLLVSALRLAQVTLLNRSLPRPVVLLVDDLAAELDAAHRARLLDLLQATGAQLFVTTTDPALIPVTSGEARMFHVERGVVREVL